jgi:hypothetical protein
MMKLNWLGLEMDVNSKIKWHDKVNNIYDEDYVKVKRLNIFGLKLNVFKKSTNIRHSFEFVKESKIGFEK